MYKNVGLRRTFGKRREQTPEVRFRANSRSTAKTGASWSSRLQPNAKVVQAAFASIVIGVTFVPTSLAATYYLVLITCASIYLGLLFVLMVHAQPVGQRLKVLLAPIVCIGLVALVLYLLPHLWN